MDFLANCIYYYFYVFSYNVNLIIHSLCLKCFYLFSTENIKTNELNTWDISLASSMSKFIASTSTYPHEVKILMFSVANYLFIDLDLRIYLEIRL